MVSYAFSESKKSDMRCLGVFTSLIEVSIWPHDPLQIFGFWNCIGNKVVEFNKPNQSFIDNMLYGFWKAVR